MMISALGTRGETAEAVDTEALYTYGRIGTMF